jgi:hypothetical protein
LIVLQTLPDLNSSYTPELTANVVNDSCMNKEVQYKFKKTHRNTIGCSMTALSPVFVITQQYSSATFGLLRFLSRE